MHTPLILEEHEFIFYWARKYKENHNVTDIINWLTSEDPIKKDVETLLVRDLYKFKKKAWKENIILAIKLDMYRKDTDIMDGDIVSNGDIVGFAKNFNFKERTFVLDISKTGQHRIGMFQIDDFCTIKAKPNHSYLKQIV